GSQTLAMATGKGTSSQWGAPQMPGAGSLPYNLLTGAGPALAEPPFDPETPVVPIPGALPLMLTALAALAALKRARKRAAGFCSPPLQG
ncbi:MAG: hypothetical protein WD076_12450, partial [Parvularculaceae bacterium]